MIVIEFLTIYVQFSIMNQQNHSKNSFSSFNPLFSQLLNLFSTHTMVLDSRLKEFQTFIDKSKQDPLKKQERKFYEDIYDKIVSIEHEIDNSTSYKSFLVIDDKISKILEKIVNFDMIVVDKGLEGVFEGIKFILKLKILKLKEKISEKKFSNKIVLREERPTFVSKKRRNFTEEDLEMERENKQIISGKEYEATRQRLIQIDEVQRAINEQLYMQDERIDNIAEVTKDSKKTYKAINEMKFNNNGSFFKRILYKVIIILTIVLIFLHLFNRR